jgi:hypothetical protein
MPEENPNSALPDESVLMINPRKAIEQAARLEAMMTFKKRQLRRTSMDAVYLYPDIIKNKSDLFYFAMTYGVIIHELEAGNLKVDSRVEEIFRNEK